jgi:chromosome segregation protein
VFLKSLTLKGFKSFAEPTILEFEPGVTVVVGPNGSGKSNVVDAVAWVLGAQGPSTVRSAKMDDVIFAGSPKRAALGRAEVSLTIDNGAGLLPIDFSEVTITRTLFRSGESEYAINRVPCRLLDIQDLLSDTGVGRQQHVIVSQGNLDAILNSRPEDRRLVIEEAAGVLKFRRRRERSQRRLDATEASLIRLQDLLREVRRQLRPLERQADAARRHDDLIAELAAVRRYLFGRDLGSVETRLTVARRDRGELGRAESEVRSALATVDADLLAAEAESQAARTIELDGDLLETGTTAERCKAQAAGLVAVLEERRRSLRRVLTTSADHDVIAALEAEAAALSARLADAVGDAARLLPLTQEVAEVELQLAGQARVVDEHWRSEPPVSIDAAAEVRGELAALRRAFDRAGAEARGLDNRLQAIEARLGRVGAERQRLGAAAREAAEMATALEEAEGLARQAESAAEADLDAALTRRGHEDAEHHRWVARAEALAQAMDEARARAGVERLAEVTGVMGTLLELVEVDDGFEVAFAAAAGPVLAAVVVDGVDTARLGLAEMRRLAAAGAVAVLPDAGAGGGDQPADRGWVIRDALTATAATPLRDRVRAQHGGVAALLDDLLAGVVVVDGGWEAAVDQAVASPELVVVTRAGDRCGHGLWQLGAGASGVTGAALDEAGRQMETTGERAAAADAAWHEARQAVTAARAAHDGAARALAGNTTRGAAAEDACRRLDDEMEEISSEHAVGSAHRQELADRLIREQARVAELESTLPELERAAAVESERAAAERVARSRLAESTAALAAQRRDLEVQAAGVEARRAMTSRRLDEVQERLRRNVADRDEATRRREDLEGAVTVVARLIGLVEVRQVEVEAILIRSVEARRVHTEAARRRADRIDGLRRRRSDAERRLTEIREKAARMDLEEAEARLRMEGLTEAIRRDLDSEPEGVRGAPCPPLPPGTSPSSRRSELERELRLMGPVNPLALEEHTALLERHQFLEAQLEDVRGARRELMKVIRAIDAEIVEVFRAAYADVADHFERLFATLFPGGQGRLRLTDPEHLLETGIEVEARPSGKNVRRLSLLSGGERSLTAMAFLFAVFRSRPSPFYLMDEVEAALDDVNLHRFLDLLQEFRSEAQLVVVTHQKRTMEAADCLYGVTMGPGGSSRVVTEGATVSAPA